MAKSTKRKIGINPNQIKGRQMNDRNQMRPTSNRRSVINDSQTSQALPLYEAPKYTEEELSIKKNNLQSFMNNGNYMDQIHMFSKKAEVITDILTNFYKVRLVKHGELIECLNVNLFDTFEVLEIILPNYQILGTKHRTVDNPEVQNIIPNITIVFSSGRDSLRNNNIIISIIDTVVKEDERNPQQAKFIDNLIQLFTALFPDSTIYNESVNYSLEQTVYNPITYLMENSKLLYTLATTDDDFLNLNEEEFFDDITEDLKSAEQLSDNYFINIFNTLRLRETVEKRIICHGKVYMVADASGVTLDENGNEIPTSVKFPYPVNIELYLEPTVDMEYEDSDEYENTIEEVVYNGGRPITDDEDEDLPTMSPEGMNDK